VYCGEHYILDLLAGVVYALVVHLALNRWEAHRAQRRAAAEPLAEPAETPREATPAH
jgi:membrane-associated phospholipid phosphatase